MTNTSEEYSEDDLAMAFSYSRYKPRSKTVENLALLFAQVRRDGYREGASDALAHAHTKGE